MSVPHALYLETQSQHVQICTNLKIHLLIRSVVLISFVTHKTGENEIETNQKLLHTEKNPSDNNIGLNKESN